MYLYKILKFIGFSKNNLNSFYLNVNIANNSQDCVFRNLNFFTELSCTVHIYNLW